MRISLNMTCFLKYVRGCLSVSFIDNWYVFQSPKGPSLREQNGDETTCELCPHGRQETSGKFSQIPQCFLSRIFSLSFPCSFPFLPLKCHSFSWKVLWIQWKEECWVGLSVVSYSNMNAYVPSELIEDRDRYLSFCLVLSGVSCAFKIN